MEFLNDINIIDLSIGVSNFCPNTHCLALSSEELQNTLIIIRIQVLNKSLKTFPNALQLCYQKIRVIDLIVFNC